MDKLRRLNRAEALSGDEFHHGECTRVHGPRGGEKETIVRYRRTGANKTWKTRSEDFRVPVKFGMRAHDSWAITPDNVEEFHLASRCPLETVEYRRVLPDGRVLEIQKWGGGTLGKRYDGDWYIVLTDKEGRPVFDDTLRTGTPKTHAEVDVIAMEFVDGESDG